MKRTRTQSVLAALVAATVLAGCSSSEGDEARLAEPVIDFPATSTTASPTTSKSTSTSTSKSASADEDDEEETTKSSSTSSSKTSEKSSSEKKTSTKKTSEKSTSTRKTSTRRAAKDEVEEQVITETVPVDDGSNGCAWPAQGEGSGNQEYSTFCDGTWARTITPENEQEYFWTSEGGTWTSVDPTGSNENGVCWAREPFAQAPEAVKNAVPFCA
ncbi:hypothetical protein FPH17_06455 [Corynebacterium godavarianum]|uniref:Secreted protein n=1 Tax=Corynebacterium godavarianum TaxID=2054421 RepID=A0ABY3E4D6_9CORY|nr:MULTISPECIES: hypothetical protein [Corynebacterium]MBL7286511.1 hypothetical protein [Corynebacterium godavarianum]TSJ74391.1 hypothetical protein FPH17_06455 [Corynebacterium godavarianum]